MMIHHDIHHPSQPTDLQYSARFPLLATLAIITQILLLASAWLLPLVSEFSLIGDNISELVLGQFGVIQTLAFLVGGIGTLGLAYTIRQLTLGVRGSLIGSLLIGLYGVGAILIAFFPTDRIDSPADAWPQSPIGTIHTLVALVSFLCMVIGMFVLTWTFARDRRWRSRTVWSGIFASGSLALFFAQSEGPWVGLRQRLLVSMIAAWLIMVAFRVHSLVRADSLAYRADD